MKKLREVEIIGIRTPAAAKEGFSDIVGQTLPVSGNAFDGFVVILPDGETRDLFHYFYKPIYA